jgi:hypothetical protein
MNGISGDANDSIPSAGINSGGGGGVDLSKYLDIADPTQTQANTIPVFETTGQKRLKLTTFSAGTFNTRITTNTNTIATKANQTALDALTTTVGTKANQTALDAHTGSGTLHANVGKTGQGTQAVALGAGAGSNTQGARSVAIGYNAGANNQSVQGVTLGHSAGKDGQGQDAIAIGYSAASTNQGSYAIAIGSTAANTGQGERAIAIGKSAAAADQTASSIAINATTSAITANQQGLFVAPVRDSGVNLANGHKVLTYNPTSKEISQVTAAGLAASASPTLFNDVTTSSGSTVVFYEDADVKLEVRDNPAPTRDLLVTAKTATANVFEIIFPGVNRLQFTPSGGLPQATFCSVNTRDKTTHGRIQCFNGTTHLFLISFTLTEGTTFSGGHICTTAITYRY